MHAAHAADLTAISGSGAMIIRTSADTTAVDLNALDVGGFSGTLTINATYADNTITGSAGNDIISAGGGADTITGGLGADDLTGGSGADIFMFADLDSGTGTNYASADLGVINSILGNGVDVIRDFTAGDQIDLAGITGISGVSSVAEGTAADAATAQGDIYVLKGDGTNGVANGDAVVLVNTANGEAASVADYEMAIYIVSGASVTWDATDFIVT
jgi:Ca2+-binding RTX toxin-like protein